MTPWATNGAFLEAEFEWLKTRIERIVAKNEADEDEIPFGSRAHEDAAALRAREDRLRGQLDVRIEHHRQHGSFKLGLDKLCRAEDLNEDERLVVLALVPSAIGEPLGDRIIGPICSGASNWVSPPDLMRLLDPVSVDDWLRVRRLLLPSGKLRSEGVIVVTRTGSDSGACADLDGTVYLSEGAFDVVVGLDAHDGDDEA